MKTGPDMVVSAPASMGRRAHYEPFPMRNEPKMNKAIRLSRAATGLALCAALLLGVGNALAQTYTKAQLQESYSAHLSAEGFRP